MLSLLALCASTFTGCCLLPATDEEPINVVFRFDDYSARSSTAMEEKIIELFASLNVPVTFGVIPYVCAGGLHNTSPQQVIPLPADKLAILRHGIKNGTVDVALHGYSHQATLSGHYTEFAGLDYYLQVDRLVKGKKFLEQMTGAPVTSFIPPWNKYDLNTIKALDMIGFSAISAKQNALAPKDTQLQFLPASSSPLKLRDAVETARSCPTSQSVIVVLFHEYDFKEMKTRRGTVTFQEFSDLLHWLNSQTDVRILSLRQAAQVAQHRRVDRDLLAKQN